jgi:hypothetical protein
MKTVKEDSGWHMYHPNYPPLLYNISKYQKIKTEKTIQNAEL